MLPIPRVKRVCLIFLINRSSNLRRYMIACIGINGLFVYLIYILFGHTSAN